MILKDGSGTGTAAKVTSDNRLEVEAIQRTLTQHVNEKHKKHFSLTFEAIDPVGADDYFVYIKNTGTKNLHLSKFRFQSTVIGSVELHDVTGTAVFTAGTDITPANRFLGASETLTATIKTDTDTTGLTNSATLIRLRLDVADKDYIDNAPSHIIIPPGRAMGCLWDQTTGILAGTIDCYEDQAD